MDSADTAPSAKARLWRTILVVAIALVLLNVLYGRLDVQQLHAWAGELNGALVFAAIVVLPLVGFPVSVLHALAGVRWGGQLGVTLVVISILIQLLASYGLVQLFRPMFQRRLEPFRHRIPRGAHLPVSLFTMLVPGVPYFAKNYVLPLIGVPLRLYLLLCFPMHAARAALPVVFGDMSADLTLGKGLAFGAYGAAIVLASIWAFRRLRAQLQGPPPAVNDPTPNM